MLAGLPILWSDDIDHMRDSHSLICILATTMRKAWIEQMELRHFVFATLVHPQAHVSQRTSLGPGVSIDVGAILAGYSRIDDHVRIGRGVSVGHHTQIGTYSTIHPGATICGNCQIGTAVTVGAGAVLIGRILIGDNAVIGAGSIVTKPVPAAALFAGSREVTLRNGYGPI